MWYEPALFKFRLADNIEGPISGELQEQVVQILKAEDITAHLPASRQVWAIFEGYVPADITLAKAHTIWNEEYFPNVVTPSPLPRQPLDTTCPSSLVRVGIECVQERTGGMGSFYGFEGFFVSLLISLDEKRIWDARGERAT